MKLPARPLGWIEYLQLTSSPWLSYDVLEKQEYSRGLQSAKYFDAEGNLRTKVWEDTYMGLSSGSINILLKDYEKYEAHNALVMQATNEVFKTEVKRELKQSQPIEKKDVAITINPAPEYDSVDHLQVIVKAATSVSAIQSGSYVFEQRSKGDEEVYGRHIHMSVTTTYRPGKIKQFVEQKIKAKGIKCLIYATYDDGGFKKNYMQGEKGSPEKLEKVYKDKVWRAAEGLQNIYVFNK